MRKLEEEIGCAFEPSTIDLVEPAQIAHYLLDKLPTASYKTFLSQDARKIATTIWKIFADDNLWLSIPGLENATLSTFGGWRSENGVNSSVLTYRMNIAETVSDPSIMYIVRSTDDLQRLKEMQQIQRDSFGTIQFQPPRPVKWGTMGTNLHSAEQEEWHVRYFGLTANDK